MSTPQPLQFNPPPPSNYNPKTWTLISQGAEARIWRLPFNELQFSSSTDPDTCTRAKTVICKERIKKSYRHPTLHTQLTQTRLKTEIKCLIRARRAGVMVPNMYYVDFEAGCVYMEDVCCAGVEGRWGGTVRSVLNGIYSDGLREHKRKRGSEEGEGEAAGDEKKIALSPYTNTNACKILSNKLGTAIAKLHESGIVHGDLTSSNIMVRFTHNQDQNGNENENGENNISKFDYTTAEIVLIDFGLSHILTQNNPTSNKSVSSAGGTHEDRAVDLYLFERAFTATHIGSKEVIVDGVMDRYKNSCRYGDSVMSRLAAVRLRGRKRECFG